MKIIKPVEITRAMITSCSLAEDATPAWTAGTYAVGDERHVVATGRVYRCATAGASATSPELDQANWKDMRPTNKMAPFDIYTNTQAEDTTADITYTIKARFVRDIALFGTDGGTYTVTVKDAPGGAVIDTRTGTLMTHDGGWWNYLFSRRYRVRQVIISGLPIRPNAEITITISAGSGSRRALGMVVFGHMRTLFGSGKWGGTRYGATASPVTYSYIKTEEDGSTVIVRRHKATNIRARVTLPRDQADKAVQLLQGVLDVPVAVIASEIKGYSGLTTFGLIESSPVSYDSAVLANIDINVKGII